MRICIFAEGSYPYVLGGVSSWIQNMIKSCPEHDFVIFSISAYVEYKGKYKYEIPKNVVEIRDVFLDDIKLIEKGKGKNYNLSKEEYNTLESLINGDDFSWEMIFKFFKKKKFKYASQFFMSKDYFNLIHKLYKDKYMYTPFTEFLWSIRSMYLTMFYLLKEDLPEADVYHSISTGYAGLLASNAKYLHKGKLLLSEHGIYTREREEEIIRSNWVEGYYKDLWINYFYNMSKASYEYADVITSLFNNNKILQIEIGCPEDKIKIIPNGVDVSLYGNLIMKEKFDDINIGAVLRVVPIKDIKTMLQSFYNVKLSVPNAKFYIMGPTDEDENYYKECLDLVEQLQLTDIIFTGSIDVKSYLGKMDILVLTSISEGQPLVIMEAFAAKKPFVSTNVGDCKNLLLGEHDNFGSAGYIENIMDYIGIANSIIKLARDKDLREEYGKNGYNRVLNLYKKEDYIETYKELYIKLGSGE